MLRAYVVPSSSHGMRTASVDLPWSMCAMMQKLRIRSGGVALGANADRAMGDTWDEPRRVRVTGMVLVGGRAALESLEPLGVPPQPPQSPMLWGSAAHALVARAHHRPES